MKREMELYGYELLGFVADVANETGEILDSNGFRDPFCDLRSYRGNKNRIEIERYSLEITDFEQLDLDSKDI